MKKLMCNIAVASIIATVSSTNPAQAGFWFVLPFLKGGTALGAAKGGAALGAAKGGAALGAAKGGAALGAAKGGAALGAAKGGALKSASTAFSATKTTGLVAKTFKYGGMTVGGAILADALTSAGYAMPNSEVEQNMLAEDMLKRKGEGVNDYYPIQCLDPNGVLRAMPEYYTTCPWESSAKRGETAVDLTTF